MLYSVQSAEHHLEKGAVRVVLDTNVIVSAVLFGGAPEDVLDLCRHGIFLAGMNDQMIEELSAVLRRKFRWREEEIRFLDDDLYSFMSLIERSKSLRMPKLSAGDRHILEAAAAFGATTVVTGDNDLLDLKCFRGIRIMTPRGFLELK